MLVLPPLGANWSYKLTYGLRPDLEQPEEQPQAEPSELTSHGLKVPILLSKSNVVTGTTPN